MARNNRSDMPKPYEIANFWKEKLIKHGREIHDHKTCFACLREGIVERCHITALAQGGTNSKENLHLLCPNCHKESEPFEGENYWVWFDNKDIVWLRLYRDRERGTLIYKFTQIIKEKMPKEYKKAVNSGDPQQMVALYDAYFLQSIYHKD